MEDRRSEQHAAFRPIPEPERVAQGSDWDRWRDELAMTVQGEPMPPAPMPPPVLLRPRRPSRPSRKAG